MELTMNINELEVKAHYSDTDIENVFLPLLKMLTEKQKQLKRRMVVFIAAPPGCGKTTLTYFLQELSRKTDSLTNIQAIGIDGFMYKKAQVASMTVSVNGREEPMSIYKGCPESFNASLLRNKLSEIKEKDILWPYYSRITHDSEDDVIKVTGDIVLIEGNYLLYNKDEWTDIKNYCDYSIFMTIDPKTLEERLISRKKKGGSTLEEAIVHYQVSDRRNVITVLNNHHDPDLMLTFDGNNNLISAETKV